MRATVLGVFRRSGTAKKSGQPYDFAKAIIQTSIRSGGNTQGYGFQGQEVDLDPACLPQFEGLRFPVELTLKTEARPMFGSFVTCVIGIEPVAVAKAS